MKKNFFRSSVVKTLVLGFSFVAFLLVANTTFAQSQKAIEVAMEQEITTLKQDLSQQAANSLTAPTAQTEIKAAVKYRFYTIATDYVQKYGITQGVEKTYNLFTENGTRPSAYADQAKADLLTLLNSL